MTGISPHSYTGPGYIDTVTITAPIDISFAHPGWVGGDLGDGIHILCRAVDAIDPDEYDVRGWELVAERNGQPLFAGRIKQVYDDRPTTVTYVIEDKSEEKQ